jgi:addiction module RelE/StbE family toxin
MSKKKHELRYLPSAEKDLLSIFEWIALDSLPRAQSFLEKLDKGIGKLASHPLLGRIPRDPRLQALGYRVLVIEAYLVFYQVRGRIVQLHRVVRGSRDLDAII